MEIEVEVLENSLNKLSRLVNVKKRNKNGISSSWLGLMAGSKVGMMAVSLAPSPELGDHAPFCCNRDSLSYADSVAKCSLRWVLIVSNLMSFSSLVFMASCPLRLVHMPSNLTSHCCSISCSNRKRLCSLIWLVCSAVLAARLALSLSLRFLNFLCVVLIGADALIDSLHLP